MKHQFKGKLTTIIITIAMLTIPLNSPVLADSTNESVLELAGDIGAKILSEERLATPIDETFKVNGQTIKFTESLYDGSSIKLGYTIKNNKKYDSENPNSFMENVVFSINGKPVQVNEMGAKGSQLKNGDYAGTLNIDLSDKAPDSFNLEISTRSYPTSYVKIPVKLKSDN